MTTENAGLPNPGRAVSVLGDTTRQTSPARAPLRPYRGPAPAGRRRTVLVGRLASALAVSDCLAAAVAAIPLGGAHRIAVALCPALLAQLVLNARCGLYRPAMMISALDDLPKLLRNCAFGWCVSAALLAGFRLSAAPGWGLLLAIVALNVALACLSRGPVHHARRRVRTKRPHSALVVGADTAGRRVAAAVHDHPEYGMRLVGLVARASDSGLGRDLDRALDRELERDLDLDLDRPAGMETGLDAGRDKAPEPRLPAGRDAEPDSVLESRLDPGPGRGSAGGTGTGAGKGTGTLAAPAGDGADGPQPAPELPVPVLVSHEEIRRAVIQNSVEDAFFTCHPWDDPQDAALVRLFAEQGCTVWLVYAEPAADAGPRRTGCPDHIWGFACRRLDAPPRHRIGILGKRALDIAVASLALVAAGPVLLACAAAVRWADGPGVIFRQERIGLAGRPFTVLKFRTLRPSDEQESATRWNVAGDSRMSPVGNLLRRTSLDELPQLWNVLRGDMSLVGPRPERPFFVGKFSAAHPGYAARHRMPVGITGLAQVHGLRGDTSIADRARFDNHYIETWSLWQDVRILLRTASSLFRHGGS